jgi:hypothetical protein
MEGEDEKQVYEHGRVGREVKGKNIKTEMRGSKSGRRNENMRRKRN